jgi:predicted nucleic acid-binding protein
LEEYLPYAEVMDISGRRETVCRDPDDEMLIRCALAGRCAWIVTGDRDILEIGEYGKISILTPQIFLEKVLRT